VLNSTRPPPLTLIRWKSLLTAENGAYTTPRIWAVSRHPEKITLKFKEKAKPDFLAKLFKFRDKAREAQAPVKHRPRGEREI
jgi:hypothetical protein